MGGPRLIRLSTRVSGLTLKAANRNTLPDGDRWIQTDSWVFSEPTAIGHTDRQIDRLADIYTLPDRDRQIQTADLSVSQPVWDIKRETDRMTYLDSARRRDKDTDRQPASQRPKRYRDIQGDRKTDRHLHTDRW